MAPRTHHSSCQGSSHRSKGSSTSSRSRGNSRSHSSCQGSSHTSKGSSRSSRSRGNSRIHRSKHSSKRHRRRGSSKRRSSCNHYSSSSSSRKVRLGLKTPWTLSTTALLPPSPSNPTLHPLRHLRTPPPLTQAQLQTHTPCLSPLCQPLDFQSPFQKMHLRTLHATPQQQALRPQLQMHPCNILHHSLTLHTVRARQLLSPMLQRSRSHMKQRMHPRSWHRRMRAPQPSLLQLLCSPAGRQGGSRARRRGALQVQEIKGWGVVYRARGQGTMRKVQGR